MRQSNTLRLAVVRLLPVVVFALLLVFLFAISPLSAGPAGILIVFTLLYIFIASLLYSMGSFMLHIARWAKWIPSLRDRKLYVASSIITFGPVLLLALNSLGQLTVEDFILVVLLVSIALFYSMRRY